MLWEDSLLTAILKWPLRILNFTLKAIVNGVEELKIGSKLEINHTDVDPLYIRQPNAKVPESVEIYKK